jgi:hypothetical protein
VAKRVNCPLGGRQKILLPPSCVPIVGGLLGEWICIVGDYRQKIGEPARITCATSKSFSDGRTFDYAIIFQLLHSVHLTNRESGR